MTPTAVPTGFYTKSMCVTKIAVCIIKITTMKLSLTLVASGILSLVHGVDIRSLLSIDGDLMAQDNDYALAQTDYKVDKRLKVKGSKTKSRSKSRRTRSRKMLKSRKQGGSKSGSLKLRRERSGSLKIRRERSGSIKIRREK